MFFRILINIQQALGEDQWYNLAPKKRKNKKQKKQK